MKLISIMREKKNLYPILYKGRLWHEKDCHELFVAFYHSNSDLDFNMSVYVGEGERITPDGWI